MKYIIMCGGQYEQWKTPRQLLHIGGETIVERTIRLLREAGIQDIAISSNLPDFDNLGVPVLKHENSFRGYVQTGGGSWVEAFFPMNEPACYLLGDVIFSPYAIYTIVNTHTDDIEFFASAPPFSSDYIKPYAEPFAFKVVNQKHFREAINFILHNEQLFSRRPIAWELWQVIKGTQLNWIDYTNYVVINDYTCDIDSLQEIELFNWRILND